MMSNGLPRGYRTVSNEPFAEGDGMQRSFPLRYAGYRTRQISSVTAVYREDWQGRVRLSPLPRRNLLFPSDTSARWSFNGASRARIESGILDPAGNAGARRVTCLEAGTNTGPYYRGLLSNLVVGREYTFLIWMRGVHGGELVRVGLENGSVPITRVTLGTQWQLVAHTAPFRDAGAYVVYLVGHQIDDAIEYAFAGVYLPGDVGAIIATTAAPAEVIDYTLTDTVIVTLPAPLAKQARLSWDGQLYWIGRDSLLPPNATRLEHNLVKVGARIGDIPTPLTDLWNPATCPENVLPWLAWGLSVDTWNSDWPLHIRRTRVASVIPIQQIKGTAKSVRDVVESFGGNVEIVEWWQEDPPAPAHTFKLTVTLSGQGDSGGSSRFVEEVIAEVNRTKPVRSHFTFIQAVDFSGEVGTKAALRPCVLARLQFETI